MKIITNGKEITLNEGQTAALEAGKAFLASERLFFTLSGPAGSGKTTISQEILRGAGRKICTAPTHKAKKVISRATGYPSKTIHSILGLKPNVELEGFSHENVLFDASGKNAMADYDVILIDEASMLSADLVDLIKTTAKNLNKKIFFLGDSRQLPPVKEAIGKVFTDPEIELFSITKVERQKDGNPVIQLYDKILSHIDLVDECQAKLDKHRLALKSPLLNSSDLMTDKEIRKAEFILNDIPFPFESQINSTGEGYEFLHTSQDFAERAADGFKLGEDLDNRIICWTNDSVTKWNNYIRKKLLGDYKAPVQTGEFLMAYRTVTNPDDWRDLIYENSADYMVTKVSEGYRPAQTYDEKIKADIKGFFVHIRDCDNEHEHKIFVVKEESYADFYKIEKDYGDFAKTAKNNKKWAWKLYYDFRNQFALIGDIKDASGKKKLVEKDFDYGYAITVHKSQGSSYENDFVVWSDIMRNTDARERNRLCYVAVSRQRKLTSILI